MVPRLASAFEIIAVSSLLPGQYVLLVSLTMSTWNVALKLEEYGLEVEEGQGYSRQKFALYMHGPYVGDVDLQWENEFQGVNERETERTLVDWGYAV